MLMVWLVRMSLGGLERRWESTQGNQCVQSTVTQATMAVCSGHWGATLEDSGEDELSRGDGGPLSEGPAEEVRKDGGGRSFPL